MFPEETAQAAVDLGAKKILPIHWAKFVLSTHAWDDPVRRVSAECERLGITLLHPLIGGAVRIDEDEVFPRWWEGME